MVDVDAMIVVLLPCRISIREQKEVPSFLRILEG